MDGRKATFQSLFGSDDPAESDESRLATFIFTTPSSPGGAVKSTTCVGRHSTARHAGARMNRAPFCRLRLAVMVKGPYFCRRERKLLLVPFFQDRVLLNLIELVTVGEVDLVRNGQTGHVKVLWSGSQQSQHSSHQYFAVTVPRV